MSSKRAIRRRQQLPRKGHAGSVQEWISCSRKIIYETKVDSDRVVRSMRKSGRGDDHLVSYPCRHCSGWHVGNTYRQRY
jgi:hypothetical protein